MFEIDFNNVIKNRYVECLTHLNSKDLVLLDFEPYEGLVTMQNLPNGGVQSIINCNLIITTSRGFYSCKEVIYDGVKLNIEELYKEVKNLVNLVLPC